MNLSNLICFGKIFILTLLKVANSICLAGFGHCVAMAVLTYNAAWSMNKHDAGSTIL